MDNTHVKPAMPRTRVHVQTLTHWTKPTATCGMNLILELELNPILSTETEKPV